MPSNALCLIFPAGGDVIDEEEAVHDEPDSDGENAVREIMFTFESFELVSFCMFLYNKLTKNS